MTKGLNQDDIEWFESVGSLVSHYEKVSIADLNNFEMMAELILLELDKRFHKSITDIVTLFCISSCNSMVVSREVISN